MDIATLEPLVGSWTTEAVFPPDREPPLPAMRGTARFAWILDGAFLLQETAVDHPLMPDAYAVIAPAPAGDGFLEHYFDARGVIRRYALTFADGTLTLARAPDPPDFHQRFAGRLRDDGTVLAGAWHARAQDGTWAKDFDLTYRRAQRVP